MSQTPREIELEARIADLETELVRLRAQSASPGLWEASGKTVRVPEPMQEIFNEAQKTVSQYFSNVAIDPGKASIRIGDERYVLLRASSLSVDFLSTIQNLYADLGEEEAFAVGRNFLFDISHVIGMEDARNFHEKMELTDPIARLSTGPVHFAYAGWAFVDISDESRPRPDDSCFIKYDHPFSFEADAWIKAGRKSEHPVCIMNAGYSSGWCEQSFGVELTSVEISCKAAGDESCTFIMAPPGRVREYLKRYESESSRTRRVTHQVPSFFERKRVEEEMKSARRKAEESDRMKSEFLTNISHEIRTPMNALIGMIELVLETPLAGEQRDYLNTSLESAEGLMEIINQILDFSKIESGQLEIAARPMLLRELVEETIRPLEVQADEKGLSLSWDVAQDVPDGLLGDPLRLRQVLVNLTGNAIKFTESGGVQTHVRVQQQSGQKVMLHVTVTDTGIGIPPDRLDSIFEAFTQVDMSTTRQYGGTGLGLSISARLVEMMGGRIWAENNPAGGSTFHFTCQFAIDVPPAHPELVDQPALIVADRPQHLKTLEALLKKLRMNVMTANSSHIALDILTNRKPPGGRPPLLLTDVDDNLILLEAIRSRPDIKTTPVVALITGDDHSDLQRLKELAITDCLVKPIRQSKLISAIKQALVSEQVVPVRPVPVNTQSVPDPETGSGGGADEAGIRILLVEDGATNQKFATAMLNRWGHEVEIANNGVEALDILDRKPNHFDLVLMDVLMPVMDGLQATEAIRDREKESGAHMPIVAITAQAMKEDRDRCLAAGMDDYLSKPIRRRALQEIIAQLLG